MLSNQIINGNHVASSSYNEKKNELEKCQRHSNLHLEYSQIRQEIDWFGYRNAGELSSHLVKNHENIREGFGFCLTDFIIRLSRIIASLIFSFYVGWKLTLIFLSISPLIVLSFNHLIEVIIKYTILELLAYNTANYIAQDVLVAIRTVIAFGEQDKETEQYRKNLSDGERVSIQKVVGISIIFWDGPLLIRNECQNSRSGHWMVVCVN
ncbi:unnamed protein product [Rotaria sordida]|uniref:ABC transmembrane type-1 domain-containing protein n=1 Tax=Rotaria sordida TaxID=392033 RepID=A0A815LAM1_9BILA|nr:unnamed protein product [Rotaria sordida]